MPTQRTPLHVNRPLSRPAASAPPSPLARAGLSVPSGGQALDRHTSAEMSAKFGHDFSHVRIHSDARAAASAEALGANAYAWGGDIVFGAGKYQPGSRETELLLAHELTHVAQQDRFGPGDWGRMSARGDASECEADSLAYQVMAGRSVDVRAAPGAALARDDRRDDMGDGAISMLMDAARNTGKSLGQDPPDTALRPGDAPTHGAKGDDALPPWLMSSAMNMWDSQMMGGMAPHNMGQRPGDGLSGPYAYRETTPNIGESGGLGLEHAHYGGTDPLGGQYDATLDIGFANYDLGQWVDGAGYTRHGLRASGGALNANGSYTAANGVGVGADVQLGTAGGEFSYGDDGITIGGGTTTAGGALSLKDKHQAVRLGGSGGSSAGFRTHTGADKEGFRDIGLGIDIGPFTGDYTTNDSLRSFSGLDVSPDINLTEMAANKFGYTTRNEVPIDQDVLSQNMHALMASETREDLSGPDTAVAHEEIPKAPIQMLPPDKDPWR